MGVDDVERPVGEGQFVDAGLLKDGVRAASPVLDLTGRGDDVAREVYPRRSTWSDPLSEIGGDGPWTAANVQKILTGLEMRQEKPGRILGRAPLMTAQHRLVVSVRVALSVIGHQQRLPNGSRIDVGQRLASAATPTEATEIAYSGICVLRQKGWPAGSSRTM